MPTVYDIIRQMVGPKTSAESLEACLNGWREYFQSLRIFTPEEQRTEFDSIMRMRVMTGVVSVSAPTKEEFGL